MKQKDTKYYQTHSLLRIFLSYFKPHRKLFALDILCATFIAAVDLAFPLVSRTAMKELLPKECYRYNDTKKAPSPPRIFLLYHRLLGSHLRHPRGGGHPARSVPPHAVARL